MKDWRTVMEQAAADPVTYWDEVARNLEWSQPWDQVLDDSNAPHYEWFKGAKTNIVTNAVDRHLKGPPQKQARIAVAQ